MLEKKSRGYKICKIFAIALLAVSFIFAILQGPVFELLLQPDPDTEGIMGSVPYITPSVEPLFLICILLFLVYVLFPDDKVTSKFLIAGLGVMVYFDISAVYSYIKGIIDFTRGSGFSTVTSFFVVSVVSSLANIAINLAGYVFLFFDAIMNHKLLKASRIIIIIYTAYDLISVFRIPYATSYLSHPTLFAIISSSRALLFLALLIYYWGMAENKKRCQPAVEPPVPAAEVEGDSATEDQALPGAEAEGDSATEDQPLPGAEAEGDSATEDQPE